jgi:hypothetical protein
MTATTAARRRIGRSPPCVNHFLNQFDPKTGERRDLQVLHFKVVVLERYFHHSYCQLDITDWHNSILKFLDKNKEVVTEAWFHFNDDKNTIMMVAEEFVGIPPKERNYWLKYSMEKTL